jgi:hypothetical protein
MPAGAARSGTPQRMHASATSGVVTSMLQTLIAGSGLGPGLPRNGSVMTDLTNLESKLGEVTGLAMAAKTATQKVMKLAREDDKNDLVQALEGMLQEATQTEERCTELAGNFEGKKTAILEEARETKQKAAQMLEIYLDEESDVLDGFEFLTMAEAGEAGHWEVLEQMASSANAREVQELVSWALPIQQRHFETARKTSTQLAADENPNEES